MPTLWQQTAQDELLRRLEMLRPDAAPRWGRMNCPQMLAHVNDALRMATGELPTAPKKLALRYPPLKQLIIYVLPFPKGAPTARELVARADRAVWATERAAFSAVLAQFAARRDATDWPLHPAFGRLSRRAWGVLAYRHIDHHFRQFGV